MSTTISDFTAVARLRREPSPLALPQLEHDRAAREAPSRADLVDQEPFVVRRKTTGVIDKQRERRRMRRFLERVESFESLAVHERRRIRIERSREQLVQLRRVH